MTNELMSGALVKMALEELQGWIPDSLLIGIGQSQACNSLFFTLLFQHSL